jgi:hypothetical protein
MAAHSGLPESPFIVDDLAGIDVVAVTPFGLHFARVFASGISVIVENVAPYPHLPARQRGSR